MKLISMNCPRCGGALEVSENAKQASCPFCSTNIVIDDEVKHIQFDNTEQAGYDFEKGRIKAQQDVVNAQIVAEQARIREQKEAERKKKNLVWWVLGWIFLFPVPLTILIARSKKLKPIWKVVLIVALWGAILLIGALSSNDTSSVANTSTVAQVHIVGDFL